MGFSPTTSASSIDDIVSSRSGAWETFYKDVHRHPELSFKEKRTAGKIRDEFRRLGLETLDIAGGVIGIMRNGNGPVSMVRSELDALPVQEKTSLAYKSENSGVMHACGHDVNLTALLATAEVMKGARAKWYGTLVFVAQPAEEIVKGAQAMIDAGLFRQIPNPEQVIALHTLGTVPSGKIGFPSGLVMAAKNELDVVFRGVGTHGSAPHLGVDPIIIGSEFVQKMQTLVGRENNPFEPAVITVGSFHAGTSGNVISDEAKLQMTVRSFSSEVSSRLLKRIIEIANGLAKNANAPEPRVVVTESAPVLANRGALIQRFRDALSRALGKDVVVDAPPIMASEDFGLFADKIGGHSIWYWVGTGDASGAVVYNHSPKYAPEIKTVLPLAVKAMVAGLLDLHKSENPSAP
jgi:hippurate hydrolase